MNRERAKELLPIIEAYSKGGTVQIRLDENGRWIDVDEPDFRGYDGDYRIKPEPHDIKWAAEQMRFGYLVRRSRWMNCWCYCTASVNGVAFYSDGALRSDIGLRTEDLTADDWEIYEPKGNQ